MSVFRIRKNRFVVWIHGIGPVPAADSNDDAPKYEATPPRRIGDDSVIRVEGQRRMVRLLEDRGGELWLVDRGPA